MQTKSMTLATILSVVLAGPCFAKPANALLGDARGIERANARFYQGLNTMFTGDASPMEQIWSHSDDVTYMGPAGGFQLGWAQVQAAWEAQAALKLGGEIVVDALRVVVGRELAIVHCRESGNNLDAQGRPQQVSIRATNVFRKENGEWKMIGHHTDLLPFLAKEPRATPAK